MTQKILFVDDDPRILKGVRRQLADQFDLQVAECPEEALRLVDGAEQFAVVVSDMRMPGMSGIELLSEIRTRCPDTVRIMLTGFADLESTIEAVNEGNIFRFLSKPCAPEILEKAVVEGLQQFRLVHAEKELLEGTLHGSIKVLSEVLSLVNPLAFGRTSMVQRIALAIGQELELESLWDLKISSLLFPLGCITVSEAALECVLEGSRVPPTEAKALEKHAELAENMLRNIPRLENVARIIGLQDKGFDGSGIPRDEDVSGEEIPIEARILKVASDFEIALKRSNDVPDAMAHLESFRNEYDPKILIALDAAISTGLCQSPSREISRIGLVPGMVLARDVRSKGGQLMMARGQSITESTQQQLSKLSRNGVIDDIFEIEVSGEVQILEQVVV